MNKIKNGSLDVLDMWNGWMVLINTNSYYTGDCKLVALLETLGTNVIYIPV